MCIRDRDYVSYRKTLRRNVRTALTKTKSLSNKLTDKFRIPDLLGVELSPERLGMACIASTYLAIARVRGVSSSKADSSLENPLLPVVFYKDMFGAPVATRGKRSNFDYKNQLPSVAVVFASATSQHDIPLSEDAMERGGGT